MGRIRFRDLFPMGRPARLFLFFGFLAVFCVFFASDAYAINLAGTGEDTFAWHAMVSALVHELTGPLPKILGTIGIVFCAVSLMAGNGGAGTQRFISLIFTISIAMFAPTFVYWIVSASGLGSGATVYDAVGTVIGVTGF